MAGWHVRQYACAVADAALETQQTSSPTNGLRRCPRCPGPSRSRGQQGVIVKQESFGQMGRPLNDAAVEVRRRTLGRESPRDTVRDVPRGYSNQASLVTIAVTSSTVSTADGSLSDEA